MYHKAPLKKKDINKKNTHICFECKDNYSVFLNVFYHVRHHHPIMSEKQGSSGQKKNLFWKEVSYDTYSASMTLEMVVILPLFVSFMVFFLFLFRVLLVQQEIEKALVYTTQNMAVKCYEETPEKQKSHVQILAEAQLLFHKKLQELHCPCQFIRGGRVGIDLLQSETQGDDIVLRANYQMRAPCILLGTYSYQILQSAKSRKWIGNSTLESQKDEEQWVYVTPHGTVYHKSSACSYLDLSIRVVNRVSLLTERNLDGSIYYCCELCNAGGNASVYVTDYGTQYHGSLSCSALKRTIYMVKRSQVGGKKACSKCGAM